jgi:site-specific recombinase XerC
LTPDQLAELKKWRSEHRWSPNRLRHSAATKIRRQFGLEAAQCVLGHSNAAVTEVYAERDLQKAVEVARKIG